MPNLDLFQRALGLEEPWQVVDEKFDAAQRRLDLRIDFPKGSRFACPECGREGCPVHDTESHTWRHLNFFEHEAYLHARVPRVECPEHGVKQVKVPWARERSDFTLLFEALVMAMVKEMPVAPLAARLGETDKKIWRVVHHYVDQAVEAQDLEGMSAAGIDDTSFQRGQSYVTVFADLDPDQRRVVFVTEGRDHETVEQFAGFLADHGGEPEKITEVCQDMSQAYLTGVKDNLSNAAVTFDRFHVKQKLSEAVDEVRRQEAKQHRELLKNTRYLWLKRPANLTAKQQDWLDQLLQEPLQTARAYEWALKFDDFYTLEADRAEEYLRRWIDEVRQTEIEPLHKFCATLEAHWEGVIRWHHTQVSNGLLEGLNSLIQAAKRRARGYRTPRTYKTMIYLVAGKLQPGPQLACSVTM
jgi:transposase